MRETEQELGFPQRLEYSSVAEFPKGVLVHYGGRFSKCYVRKRVFRANGFGRLWVTQDWEASLLQDFSGPSRFKGPL